MSLHATLVSREGGWYCENCGQMNEGKPQFDKYVSLHDVYFDEQIKLNGRSVSEVIVEEVMPHVEEYEGAECEGCDQPVPEDEMSFHDQIWECDDCEDRYGDEDEAEQCCQYQREYASSQEERENRYKQEQIEQARQLLIDEGYAVQPMAPSWAANLQG